MSDSISIDELKAILSDEAFSNLRHLENVKNKIQTLTENYDATLIAIGTQLRRDQIEPMELAKIYKYMKSNKFSRFSNVITMAGYSYQQISYSAKNGTKPYPSKGNLVIYVLLKDNEIVYVGRSSNLRSRLEQHKKTKDYDSFDFVFVKDKNQMKDLEALMIQQYRPKFNIRQEKRTSS